MGIDYLFIEFMHKLYEIGGQFFTPFFRLVMILGEKAWIFLLISFIMLFKKRTRWVGLTAIIAIFLGFVIGNILLKPLIMRMRPYTASNLFQSYWELVGAYQETGYSMPSGHSIGVTAFFVSLYITSVKKNREIIYVVGCISVVLMVLSRCYFMHHYLSDCIVGVIIGFVVSYISKAIVRVIHNFCKKSDDIALFNFIINYDFGDKK